MAANIKVPTTFTAVDRFTSVVSKMTSGVSNFTKSARAGLGRFNTAIDGAWNKLSGLSQLAIGVGVAGLFTTMITDAVAYEDKLSDITKTTGLAGKDLEKYSKSMLSYSKDTRSSIDDLIGIGVVGGQLGIIDEKAGDVAGQMERFTKAADVFAVALGGDYSGGIEQAINQVGKLNSLFKDTRDLDVATSIMKTGSVFNQLGSIIKGATTENMNDFALRVGALPDALKPSFESTAALAATMQSMGVNSEIAASGFSNLIGIAAKDIGGFAKTMKITEKEASKLLNEDTAKFALKFSQSFKGQNAEQLSNNLKKLKINSNEVLKTVGALSNGQDTFTKALEASNQQMLNATSLQDESDVKNSTALAQYAKAKNALKAVSIELGSVLLPYMTKFLGKIMEYHEANPNFIKGLVTVVAVVGTLVAVIKAITLATQIYTGVQWLLNAAMLANPVGLIIAGIVALIALVGAIIYKWNEWGASIVLFLGPIGLIISLIMSLRTHWDSIKQAFTDGGILGGLKRIGIVLLDTILYPVQKTLELLGKIPGMGALGDMASSVEGLRGRLDLVPSPEQATTEVIRTNNAQSKIDLNIKDPGANLGQVNTFGTDAIKLTTTQGNF